MLRTTPQRTGRLLSLGRRPFSNSSARPTSSPYDETVGNLKIGANTRVIYQGFTGRVSTSNAQQSIDWGTKIVGGTTPGKEGEHLGLPLLPSVRQAAEQLKPDASAVFVAAQHAAKAIEDAIEVEIPLVVAVAEFIPVHDMLRIASILKTQNKTRLVGANSPGIIAPLGNCRIGFQPLPCYTPGHVGVVAKSGTLSYETVGALTRAGLGQSVCIGMGGDIVAGTSLVDALRMFENDDDTEAIVVVGEVGGRAEQDAAEWIKDYNKRVSNPKPIVAAVGGLTAPSGRIMGHAGAFASLAESPAQIKHKALKDAGVTMVSHPAHFGEILKRMMSEHGRDVNRIKTTSAKPSGQQTRGYHTSRTLTRPSTRTASQPVSPQQKRGFHVVGDAAKQLLSERGIPVSNQRRKQADSQYVAITVDRSSRCPAILTSPTTAEGRVFARSKTFPYDYNTGPDQATIKAALENINLDAAPPAAMATAGKLITTLTDLFKEKEAYAIQTEVSGTSDGNLAVEWAQFSIDDSAVKSAKRQQDLHELRDKSQEDPDEMEAAKDGIVYVKLENPEARVGTLINGAGLAMNAVDALTELGAPPTNFLDTGGKATSATIRKAFELILKDSRVKVIFVNIFGGLTDCGMIAEGIMLAFKDLEMDVPVVVRLRGTNEEEGQRMIAKSGLALHAFDDFDEAAKMCKDLAGV